MPSKNSPSPVIIIIPDTTPLIHLAAGGLLDLLPAMGRLVVPDVMKLEATRLPSKPWATEIAAWFAAADVEVAETELGGLYRMAIELGLKPPKHAGEISIIEWLSENLSAGGLGALVVFEDARVPRLLGRERFPVEVVALTTRSFLVFAQDQGILCSAEDAWHAIEAQVPNARGTFLHSTKRPEP